MRLRLDGRSIDKLGAGRVSPRVGVEVEMQDVPVVGPAVVPPVEAESEFEKPGTRP